MAVKRTSGSGKEGGYHKYHQLKVGDVDAHGFGSDAVIAYCHDGPALLGSFQIHHDQHGEHHQHDGIGQQCLDIGVYGAGIQTQSSAGEVQVGDYVLDDLAAGQRYDGKIVALEAQRRKSDDEAEYSRDDADQQHAQRQTNDQRQADAVHCDGGKAAREQSHRHEARVSQRQLAQQSDHQVQGHRHNDID